MIELRTLGSIEFRWEKRDPSHVLAHQKQFALLAYLAASHPFGLQRRDTLIALFWPELDQEHARTALRKSLHGLRQAVGADAIIANGDDAIGIVESALSCDVRQFDAAIREGRAADAFAIYRGDFLPGFFLSDAPEFIRWLERERETLRASAVRAAWALASDAERAGDTTNAVKWSRQALQLSPDDETGTRRLIALLEKIGDRAGALRTFKQFEKYLASELEVAPSVQTESLVANIRSSAPPAVSNRAIAESSVAPKFDATRGFSPEPIVAERPTRKWRSLAIASSLLAVATMMIVAVAAARRDSPNTTSVENKRVAVLPLVNETGQPGLGFVGREIQDWVTRGLQETGLVRVFAPTGEIGNARDGERSWASSLGAGLLVRGRYYLRGDSILMQISIVDVGGGDALATLMPIVAPAHDPTAGIDVVRQRTMAVLATYVDPALNQWARAASRPPSFEAYQEYSAGIQARNRNEYDAAIAHLRNAGALDSAYVYPVLIAAELESQVGSGGRDSAAMLLRQVRGRKVRLAPFDDALASALEAGLVFDLERQFEALQRLRNYVIPGSDWELDAAAAAVALNRPKEAVEIVNAVDLHRAPAFDSWDIFVPIINAYHLAGRNEELLAILNRDAGKWQNAALVIIGKIEALAALGRPAEADSLWRTLLPNRPFEKKGVVMLVASVGASELRAHGSPDAARKLAREALDSLPELPAKSPWGNPVRWKIGALREAGRGREALPLARSFSAKNPDQPPMLATIAALAAESGDTAEARRIDAKLAAQRVTDDPQSIPIARARIAAALGDKARAVALLHTACDKGCGMFEDLHFVFEFDGLRSYQPFKDFLKPKR